MANTVSHQSIDNPVTGEVMTSLQTATETRGALLRIEMRVRPGGFASGEHIHPRQEERFLIERGEITLRVNGKDRRYTAGDEVAIAAGTPHVWWNSGSDELCTMVDVARNHAV